MLHSSHYSTTAPPTTSSYSSISSSNPFTSPLFASHSFVYPQSEETGSTNGPSSASLGNLLSKSLPSIQQRGFSDVEVLGITDESIATPQTDEDITTTTPGRRKASRRRTSNSSSSATGFANSTINTRNHDEMLPDSSFVSHLGHGRTSTPLVLPLASTQNSNSQNSPVNYVRERTTTKTTEKQDHTSDEVMIFEDEESPDDDDIDELEKDEELENNVYSDPAHQQEHQQQHGQHSQSYQNPSHSQSYQNPSHSQSYDAHGHAQSFNSHSHSQSFDSHGHSASYETQSHSQSRSALNSSSQHAPLLPPFSLVLPPSQQQSALQLQNTLLHRTLSPPHHLQSMHHMQQVVIPSQLNEAQQQLLSQEMEVPTNEVKTARKARWRPTQEQKQTLESIWATNPYPDPATKRQIVKQFGNGVTYKQITSWFKHRRENDKHRGTFEYKYSPAMKFSPEHLSILESVFMSEPYAKGKSLQDLANQLGVLPKRIQNWFKHKRSRLAQQGKFEYKPRNLLNAEQITFLRGAFFTNPSPTPEFCEQLSAELSAKPEQVSRWFANERSRKRKREEHLKNTALDDSDSNNTLCKSADANNKSKRGRKPKSTHEPSLDPPPLLPDMVPL